MQKYPMLKKAEPFPEPKFNYVGFFSVNSRHIIETFPNKNIQHLFNIILHCEG